jgi:hypothetical protein
MEGSHVEYPAGKDAESLREVAALTRKYARHRTIPMLVNSAIFILGCIAIGVPAYLAGAAGRAGHALSAIVLCGISLLSCAAWLILTLPPRGLRFWGELVEKISDRLYSGEGQVTPAAPERASSRRVDWFVVILFFTCLTANVLLGIFNLIPVRYWLPASALYNVPFLVWICVRGKRPPIFYLWPFLYAVHAALIVAGTPVLSQDNLFPLNICIATFGYGILTALIGHLYSRVALARLKRLSRVPSDY